MILESCWGLNINDWPNQACDFVQRDWNMTVSEPCVGNACLSCLLYCQGGIACALDTVTARYIPFPSLSSRDAGESRQRIREQLNESIAVKHLRKLHISTFASSSDNPLALTQFIQALFRGFSPEENSLDRLLYMSANNTLATPREEAQAKRCRTSQLAHTLC